MAKTLAAAFVAILSCADTGSDANGLMAQEQFESPQQRGRAADANGRVYKGRVDANWSDDGNRFWYRNDLAGGGREFIVVDAITGTRSIAFDAAIVAKKMSEQLAREVAANKLPIERLDFAVAEGSEASGSAGPSALALIGSEGVWIWDPSKQSLTKRESQGAGDSAEKSGGLKPESELRGSSRTGRETEIVFDNRTDQAVSIFWIDSENRPQGYGTVEPKSRRAQHTFAGHRWLVENANGDRLAVFEATDDPNEAIVDGTRHDVRSARRGRGRRARGESAAMRSDRSPDGKWRAWVKEQNVFIAPLDADGDEGEAIQLSHDGSEKNEYAQPIWSPDSKSLVAFRIEQAETAEVHLIQSSPEAGGRAILTSRPYALPGDPFAKHELNVFQIESRKQLKPNVDRFEHGWESPRIRWNLSNGSFTYKMVDRGHQRLRIVSVEPSSGEVTNVIDERSETFIWTIHTEELELDLINWMERSDEVVYVSEQSGWRHLYLASVDGPGVLRPITSGEWVVRGIQQIDEANRQVWFSAGGCVPGQDPYLVHFGRVNFDGTGLTWLTAGDGEHAIEYSPDRRFIVDRYSRVDLPPRHELRRVEDGKLICELEQADASELINSGCSAPQVFTAKGRDGVTDIWGIICRPRNFDPAKKYPIIEDIYAGPQGAFVPKTFSPSQRHRALNELGFIVVQIDGMGTSNRSKAFHDVCWHNLKDGGFEDRIAWIKSAAAKHPELDVDRVGIYGVSAGGQNAAAAVLFHPEFYKAAVAGCGCHDNRMDKASWNEQWMGYPVGPHYAECSNIDNAHRLGGKLLLIVGELDDNVPPESTLRFADALIRADKDFDLLVVPNAGHGIGGAYGERRMRDFFVEHLNPTP